MSVDGCGGSRNITCVFCGGFTKLSGFSGKRWCTNCYRFLRLDDCVFSSSRIRNLVVVDGVVRSRRRRGVWVR